MLDKSNTLKQIRKTRSIFWKLQQFLGTIILFCMIFINPKKTLKTLAKREMIKNVWKA